MEEKKVYPVVMKYFLNKECRIVITDFEDCSNEDNQWLVLKDMFNCLSKYDEDNSNTEKAKEIMKNMGWNEALAKYRVTSKSEKIKSRNTQDMWCIRLSYIPSIIMRFEPRKDTPAHDVYVGYVNYVRQLLLENRILEKLFIAEQSKEEALRQFQNKIFTLAQVASDFKCKNGKELKDILVQMELVKMKNGNIDDYNAKFLNCTNKLIRVKAINIEELVNEVAQYKEANNIEDYVPKQLKSKPKKKLRCKQTGKEFTTKVQAAEYGNTGSTSINNYLKGLQAYAGKLEDGTRLTWEWVKVEEQ